MKNIIVLISLGFIFISCKKDEAATYLEGTASESISNNTEAAKNNASSMLLPTNQQQPTVVNNSQDIQTLPQNNNAPQQVQVSTNNVQTQQVTAPGMNPPHGQPGHRCDIAVGAPLNSPKVQNVQSKVTTTNGISVAPQVVTKTTPQKTAPGMNPPHGEPGHRCDIAVGEPLNSPSKKIETTSTPAQSEVTKALPPTVAAPAAASN